jgi:hypothetical protein
MAFFFVFLAHVAIEHQIKGGGPRGTPSVEAYCPFGGLETLYQFLTTGGFIRRIEMSSLILFGALVVLTLLGSRGFCGWICPFGSIQEWIGLLGKKIFRKRFNPTGAWDRGLRYLKYVVLILIIALTWHTGSLIFRDYDPFLAFFHFGNGIDELPWAYAILGGVLAGSLLIERFFCKYACPLGAALGVIGKFGLTKIVRNPADCKSCNLCQQKCHAHVDFLAVTEIRSAECNQCMDCVVDCPKPAVLSLKGPRWRFSHAAFGALLVAGLGAFVGVSQLAGKWQVKPELASFTNKTGQLDPEAIRGWMTLTDISQGYGIPLDQLYHAAGLPQLVGPDVRLNRIAATYKVKFEPDRMREVVRETLIARGAALKPAPAKVKTAAAPPAHKPERKGDKSKDHKDGAEPEVKGFMTLNEVALKTGVPKEWLAKELNLGDGVDSRSPLREWMHDQGKSIQDVRDAVEKYRRQGRP